MFQLNNEEMQFINSLVQQTGAMAEDVLVDGASIVFVVRKGDLGRAIGRDGANLERLRKTFGRNVELIEKSDTPRSFLANLFRGVAFQNVEERVFNDKKTMLLKVSAEQKGLAIGRGGEKINRARLLLKRHFGYDDLKIV